MSAVVSVCVSLDSDPFGSYSWSNSSWMFNGNAKRFTDFQALCF